DHDVENGDTFEAQGIGKVQKKVDGEHEKELIPDPPGQAETGDDQQAADSERRAWLYLARSQRTFTFDGMFPVVFAVPVVINSVDAAGNKGKSDKTIKDAEQLVDIENFATEEQG